MYRCTNVPIRVAAVANLAADIVALALDSRAGDRAGMSAPSGDGGHIASQVVDLYRDMTDGLGLVTQRAVTILTPALCSTVDDGTGV